MRRLTSFLLFIVSTFYLAFAPASLCWSEICYDENDHYIQSLASLTFYAKQRQQDLNNHFSSTDDKIAFLPEQVDQLWERAKHHINKLPSTDIQIAQIYRLENAFECYNQSLDEETRGNQEKSLELAKTTHQLLEAVWNEAIDPEKSLSSAIPPFLDHPLALCRAAEDFESMHHIPAKAKKLMRPHLIPDNHPMKDRLNRIFFSTRATLDEKHFKNSKFETISVRPRSYVRVAKHPWLEGYLVKVHLDNELRRKFHKESWEWFVKRCVGAKKLREIIDKKNIQYFTVADKWIYPLPAEPSPPKSSKYKRQLCILLVTDMQLAPEHLNLRAWRESITEKHLDELYYCISHAKGSSYRPDNIALTKKGQFAFIDTEYPDGGPDYDRIRPFLSSKMRHYWDKLVKSGGG